MPKTVNPVTLDEVNADLLSRLKDLIGRADAAEILDITNAVAKLNSSWKGNDQFARPETAEEYEERHRKEVLSDVLNGEEVKHG